MDFSPSFTAMFVYKFRYVWLPVEFERDKLTIHWQSQWTLE